METCPLCGKAGEAIMVSFECHTDTKCPNFVALEAFEFDDDEFDLVWAGLYFPGFP